MPLSREGLGRSLRAIESSLPRSTDPGQARFSPAAIAFYLEEKNIFRSIAGIAKARYRDLGVVVEDRLRHAGFARLSQRGEERERLLARAEAHGFVDDYSGVRITADGRRFRIHDCILWNVLDDNGQKIGQAACFDRWEWL